MRILRGKDPGPFQKHGDYKPHLQPLFRERCAYCITPDTRNGGLEGMTVDHFLDQKRHPELRLTWANLYYSCVVCNSHYKKDYPTEAEEKAGLRFVDPCKEDPDEHFRMVRDRNTKELCQVHGLTVAANYTIRRLHLNTRKALRDFWRELEQIEKKEELRISQIDKLMGQVDSRVPKGFTSTINSIRQDYELTKETCLGRLASIRSLRPFPISRG